MKYKNLLGIDYGRSWIGIAVAESGLAEPLVVVENSKSLSRIDNFIDRYQIEAIVVGVSEGKMADETKIFAREIEMKFGLPVYFHDETLSSQDTRELIAKAGIKRNKRENKIDHYVAAMILQDYIDSQNI